jgi:hypothetical protein
MEEAALYSGAVSFVARASNGALFGERREAPGVLLYSLVWVFAG